MSITLLLYACLHRAQNHTNTLPQRGVRIKQSTHPRVDAGQARQRRTLSPTAVLMRTPGILLSLLYTPYSMCVCSRTARFIVPHLLRIIVIACATCARWSPRPRLLQHGVRGLVRRGSRSSAASDIKCLFNSVMVMMGMRCERNATNGTKVAHGARTVYSTVNGGVL